MLLFQKTECNYIVLHKIVFMKHFLNDNNVDGDLEIVILMVYILVSRQQITTGNSSFCQYPI